MNYQRLGRPATCFSPGERGNVWSDIGTVEFRLKSRSCFVQIRMKRKGRLGGVRIELLRLSRRSIAVKHIVSGTTPDSDRASSGTGVQWTAD